MANYSTLKAAINAVIKTNGQKEITGEVLNQVLNAMVTSLGTNYQFAGVATPSTNPGTPDQNVFYMATQAGTYTNFNATVLPAGISILLWDGSWSHQTFFTIESTPTSGSTNLVTSGGVFEKMKLDGGAYDVSAHNGGTTFASLEALLSDANLNTLIPIAVRTGGMSIRFVLTSDNKYVQYRLAVPNWSTDIRDWTSEDPYFIDKIMQEVNKAIDENTPIEIHGDVTNAPDEEDLTSVNVEGTDVLKFKDKAYNPLTYSGMGRNILRKNMVNGVNILTQEMFEDGQGNDLENTIFVIQYDFTIGENPITIPANCVLEFDGGSLSNGTITGNNTGIDVGLTKIFDIDVTLAGTWNVAEAYPEWFGADNTGTAAAEQHILKCFDISDTCVLTKSYNITNDIVLPATKQLIGINRRHSSLIMTNGSIYPTSRNIIKSLNFVSITTQDLICLDGDIARNGFQYLRISDLYITGADDWNHTCDCIHIKCRDKGFEFINIDNIEIHTNVHSLIKVDGFVTDSTHYGWLTELSVTDCLVQRAVVVLDIQIPKDSAIIGCYFSNIASQAGNHSTNFAILDGVGDTIFDRMYAWDYGNFASFDSVFLINTARCGGLKIYNTRGFDTRTLKAFDGVSNPFGCVLDFSQSSASRNYRVTCTDVSLDNIDNPTASPGKSTIQQTFKYNTKDVFGNTIYFSGWRFLSSAYWGGAPVQTLLGVDVRSLRAYIGRKDGNTWKFYPIESSNYVNVTTNIPKAIFAGQRFYTVRVNNFIVFNGKRWINVANGFTPVKTIGTTSERPVGRWSEARGAGIGLRPTNGKMIFEKWSYRDATAQKVWIANSITEAGVITWVEETTLNANAPYDAPRVGSESGKPSAKYAYNNLYVGFAYYDQNTRVFSRITSLRYDGTNPDDDNAYSIEWDIVTETALIGYYDKGFCYFDTTLNKPIYAISVNSTGVVTWADATGVTV